MYNPNIKEDLLALVEDGMLDKDYVLLSLIKYLSDDEIHEMCKNNELPTSVEGFVEGLE
jgi:hypothetical protein